MSINVKPIPEGYHTLPPHLVVCGAADALKFYKKAFGATETFRLNAPDGKIAHAEFKIGDSPFMPADKNPQYTDVSPEKLGGSPAKLHLYVTDPFGHHWVIATHIEDVDPTELPSRMAAFFAAHAEH